MKVLELFGGIGAPRKALERLGIEHKVVDYVEIDKYAVKSYNAIFNENYEPIDICDWDKKLDVDLVFHGSPCQDFSIAGKNKGGEKGSGTRSSLLYETIRIVRKLRPKYILWENVKNVISKKHIDTFNHYLEELKKLGYNNFYQVLNAKDYGIPQNRERVFVVSIKKELKKDFKFPCKETLKLKLKDLLEDEVDEKFYLSQKQTERIEYSKFNQAKTRIQEKEYCDTLLARDYKDPKCIGTYQYGKSDKFMHGKNRFQKSKNISDTVQTTQKEGVVIRKNKMLRIRKLTPKECWRLMGFDDEDFYKAQSVGISNTQLYKQAGNSIVVNVLEKIFKELL